MSTQEVSEEEFKRLWATNVVGLFGVTKRLAPLINEGAARYPTDPPPALTALALT